MAVHEVPGVPAQRPVSATWRPAFQDHMTVPYGNNPGGPFGSESPSATEHATTNHSPPVTAACGRRTLAPCWQSVLLLPELLLRAVQVVHYAANAGRAAVACPAWQPAVTAAPRVPRTHVAPLPIPLCAQAALLHVNEQCHVALRGARRRPSRRSTANAMRTDDCNPGDCTFSCPVACRCMVPIPNRGLWGGVAGGR